MNMNAVANNPAANDRRECDLVTMAPSHGLAYFPEFSCVIGAQHAYGWINGYFKLAGGHI